MTGRLYDRLNIFSPFHSPDTAHLFYIEIYVLIRFPMQRLVKRMAKTRKILPLDPDAFSCPVAEQLDPTIKGRAVVLGAKPSERGAGASALPGSDYCASKSSPLRRTL